MDGVAYCGSRLELAMVDNAGPIERQCNGTVASRCLSAREPLGHGSGKGRSRILGRTPAHTSIWIGDGRDA